MANCESEPKLADTTAGQASSATPPPKPRRRWFQFSLASLFLLVTLVAIGCAWFRCKMVAANRREGIVAVIRADALVMYDYEFSPSRTPPGPEWLRDLVGLDFLADPVFIMFDKDAPENALDGIEELTELGFVFAPQSVTDARLEDFRGLNNLMVLYLEDSEITDTGLECLRGLEKLERIHLFNTRVTDDGVARLQEALPDCWISREMLVAESR